MLPYLFFKTFREVIWKRSGKRTSARPLRNFLIIQIILTQMNFENVAYSGEGVPYSGAKSRASVRLSPAHAVIRMPSTGEIDRLVWDQPRQGHREHLRQITQHHFPVNSRSWRSLLPRQKPAYFFKIKIVMTKSNILFQNWSLMIKYMLCESWDRKIIIFMHSLEKLLFKFFLLALGLVMISSLHLFQLYYLHPFELIVTV